ncbi:hypothetical protein GOB57_03910 [Sinorhizobium meliloti]|nr:hypothetical protein [Sinorhizobium meliloti]
MFAVENGEGNTVEVAEGAIIDDRSRIIFRPFFNGTGGLENEVRIGARSKLHSYRIDVRGVGNTIVIGADCSIRGAIEVVGTGLSVEIGSGTTINGAHFNCREQSILVGKDCLFSSGINVRSSDVHKIFDRVSGDRVNVSRRPVSIGDHVWLGQHVFVGKNASIPSGCVVGAGATITKRLEEADCVIVGAGEVKRRNIRWEK